MKIDKSELRALAEKSDEELWAEIKRIADEHGYKLGDISPRAEDLAKVRSALRGTERLNMREAIRLINSYKKS